AVGAFRRLRLSFAQARRLSDSLAQIIKLGAAHAAGALHFHLGNFRRMNGENALDTFALHDAANSERLAHAFAAPADDRAAEDLYALLLSFQDALVNIHLIADVEIRNSLAILGLFHGLHESILHRPRLPFASTSS